MSFNDDEYYKNLFDIIGYDKSGMSQVRVNTKYFNKNIDYNKFVVHVLKILSQSILLSQKNGYNQYFVLVYLDDTKVTDLDIAFLKNMIDLLDKTFPNALHKCYLINFPPVIKPVYKLLSKFIDKETRNKFKILKKSSNKKSISDF